MIRGLQQFFRERAAGALVISIPGDKPRRFRLPEKEIRVGRAAGNDLILNHHSVSREHSRLYSQGGRLLVEDLGSKNGTYFDGRRLEPGQPAVLQPRTQLAFGEVRVRLRPGVSPTVLAGGLAGAGLIGAVLICAAAVAVAGLLRGEEKQVLDACDQPALPILVKGGQTFPAGLLPTELPPGPAPADTGPEAPTNALETPGAGAGDEISAPPTFPAPTLPPSRPIVSLAFLELPFPYDGGNERYSGTLAQFRQASQRSANGGRVNSFFDHMLPLYPASNDPNIPGGQEPAEDPVGGQILLYTGQLSPYDNYSGHPALDFSTFVRRQPTTPVFAAADGVITAAGEHSSSGALFVRLKHSVPEAGDFQTTYWHLEPDPYFEAMLGREGQAVTAGTRLGTMGNTGWSTGHHLHFEVRFDRNRDGFFSGGEVVDPYGFIPSVEYPGDPWFERSGLASPYLWVHPLGVTAAVAEDGGGQVDTGGTGGAGPDEISLCAPPGSLPPGGTVQISWVPDPPPLPGQAGAGRACTVSVLDGNGNPVASFDPPVEVSIPFTLADIAGLDPDSLAVYWLAPGREDWQPLPTQIDFEAGVAVARSDRPGQCALLGDPLEDRIPPVTRILSDGASLEGVWYDTVTITLEGMDESGIARTEFSLDGGTTWQLYSGPFVLQPGPIPAAPLVMDEQFFAGGPGTHLVLASSTDNAGNVEDPPAYLQLSIDPSKRPDGPSPTPGRTPSASPSPTVTLAITDTPQGCAPTLTVVQNAFCRAGPGSVYDTLTGYQPGTVLAIDGQNQDGLNKWWRVRIPDTAASCWISDTLVQVSEGAACAQVLQDPPTPTPSPSPLPSRTPTKSPNIYP